ncbi:hypothetical protein [Streptomyces hygroscopicus]|uniref:hypothetical protein n=1 Tax=Streptomyces hygroscopicus TaxID=1912 RepID=UPI00223FB99E|nr:hypothetical protein [Streptomyces hygroscopicus]
MIAGLPDHRARVGGECPSTLTIRRLLLRLLHLGRLLLRLLHLRRLLLRLLHLRRLLLRLLHLRRLLLRLLHLRRLLRLRLLHLRRLLRLRLLHLRRLLLRLLHLRRLLRLRLLVLRLRLLVLLLVLLWLGRDGAYELVAVTAVGITESLLVSGVVVRLVFGCGCRSQSLRSRIFTGVRLGYICGKLRWERGSMSGRKSLAPGTGIVAILPTIAPAILVRRICWGHRNGACRNPSSIRQCWTGTAAKERAYREHTCCGEPARSPHPSTSTAFDGHFIPYRLMCQPIPLPFDQASLAALDRDRAEQPKVP